MRLVLRETETYYNRLLDAAALPRFPGTEGALCREIL
jgi:hypothetical protein